MGRALRAKAYREGFAPDLVDLLPVETSLVDAKFCCSTHHGTSQQPSTGAMYVSREKIRSSKESQRDRQVHEWKGAFRRLRICALYDEISINILAVSRTRTPTPGSPALARVAPRASALLRCGRRRPNKGEVDGDGLVQQLLLVRAVYCRAGFLDGSVFDERITLYY
jgi:hypothetical protein